MNEKIMEKNKLHPEVKKMANKAVKKAGFPVALSATAKESTSILHEERSRTALLLKTAITRSISKVHTATRLQLNQELSRAGIDITPDMYLILRALWEKDQRSQQELADDVLKDKGRLTKLVANLEKRDLIYRTAGSLDRRSKIVALTAKGNALRTKVYPIALGLIEQLESGFSAEELRQLRQMLEKMHAKLKR